VVEKKISAESWRRRGQGAETCSWDDTGYQKDIGFKEMGLLVVRGAAFSG
jgi:hypothetical protein